MAHALADITETIGNTALVHLARVGGADILIKLEKINPTQSMKDRMALAIIEGAERRGELQPGGTVIESSSGNTATALAMICAVKGYRFIAVVDAHAASEKIAAVRAYGGEVFTVGGSVGEGVVAAKERLDEVGRLQQKYPKAVFANQADNPDNPRGYEALAQELAGCFDPCDGDGGGVLIGSVGSGGSLCGTACALRALKRWPMIVAVEPVGSITFGAAPSVYFQSGPGTPAGAPVGKNVDVGIINRIYRVTDRQSFNTARVLARRKGLLVGGSAAASVFTALCLLEGERSGSIVVLAADGGEKYLSTIFDDNWMRERELLDEGIERELSERLMLS